MQAFVVHCDFYFIYFFYWRKKMDILDDKEWVNDQKIAILEVNCLIALFKKRTVKLNII